MSSESSNESSECDSSRNIFIPPPEAPTLYPTPEDFADPLEYFEKIIAIGMQYGIVKIVPSQPEWKMYMALNIDKVCFKVRRQKLFELDVDNRSAKTYCEKLTRFWTMHSQDLQSHVIESVTISYYRLKCLVNEHGGFEQVERNQEWDVIAMVLLEKNHVTIESKTQIRAVYCDIIQPYEKFIKLRLDRQTTEQEFQKIFRQKAESNKTVQMPSFNRARNESFNNSLCMVCYKQDDDERLLICDRCDDYYHTYCLIPALEEIPSNSWLCPLCCIKPRKKSEAYSFVQRDYEYKFDTYMRKAIKWKSRYFRSVNSDELTSNFIERKYWSLFRDEQQPVVVEYGTDLPASDFGSGFPTADSENSSHPLYQEMMQSKWNLNNLPKLNGSVLRYLPEISGVTSPWLYVGMCFSTFCWHVEDHWLPSVNYLHCGDMKTWYGIPPSSADKFESYLRTVHSDLFENQPDLLHHLTLMVNPRKLIDAGIPVYRLDQKEGEFVVTFPRAYHAGFNQGFNVAEAVNFATFSWLRIGRMSVKSYVLMKRKCVFSHDRLLYNIVKNYENIEEKYIYDVYMSFLNLISHEHKLREELSSVAIEKLDDNFRENELSDCEICNTSCFLSMVTCACIKHSCLEHYNQLCSKCSPTDFSMRQRFSMTHLTEMMFNLILRSSHYKAWRNDGLEMLTAGKIITTLKDLENWIRIGREKKYPDWQMINQIANYVANIKKCFSRIFVDDLESTIKSTCTMAQLHQFVRHFNSYPFRLIEFKYAFKMYRACLQFENMSKVILGKRINCVNKKDLEAMLRLKSNIKHILLPSYKRLNDRLKQIMWIEDVTKALKTPKELSLVALNTFFNTGLSWMRQSPNKELIQTIKKKIMTIKSWEKMVAEWLNGETDFDILALRRTIRKGHASGMILPSMSKLVELRQKLELLNHKKETLPFLKDYAYDKTVKYLVDETKKSICIRNVLIDDDESIPLDNDESQEIEEVEMI